MVTAAVVLLLLPWMLCVHCACTLQMFGGCCLADGGKHTQSLLLVCATVHAMGLLVESQDMLNTIFC